MGCCQSCLGKQEGETTDETTSLLQPEGPVAPNISTNATAADFTRPATTIDGSVPHNKHDEQSILSSIVQQYNSDVIDITSLDSKIDAVEYMNRVQMYNRKVAAQTGALRYKIYPLYSSGNDPVAVLGGAPVDVDDVTMITQLSEDLQSAMKSVCIIKQNDLVRNLGHR